MKRGWLMGEKRECYICNREIDNSVYWSSHYGVPTCSLCEAKYVEWYKSKGIIEFRRLIDG